MRISDWSSDVCSSDLLPERANAINLTATLELIRKMESSPTAKRLIFASSMTVAGQDQHRRVPPLRVDEPPQPGDVYGRSKAECERRIQDSQLGWSILRSEAPRAGKQWVSRCR